MPIDQGGLSPEEMDLNRQGPSVSKRRSTLRWYVIGSFGIGLIYALYGYVTTFEQPGCENSYFHVCASRLGASVTFFVIATAISFVALILSWIISRNYIKRADLFFWIALVPALVLPLVAVNNPKVRNQDEQINAEQYYLSKKAQSIQECQKIIDLSGKYTPEYGIHGFLTEENWKDCVRRALESPKDYPICLNQKTEVAKITTLTDPDLCELTLFNDFQSLKACQESFPHNSAEWQSCSIAFFQEVHYYDDCDSNFEKNSTDWQRCYQAVKEKLSSN